MLNAKLMEIFIEAACEFFEMEANLRLEKETVFTPESKTTSQEVNILLGVTGAVHGQLIYAMPADAAKLIASEMIGQPIELSDFMAQSAISELGNMISGLAIQKLADTYSDLAVTPPTFIYGKNIILSTGNNNRLCAVLAGNTGRFELTLALKEREVSSISYTA